MTGGRPARSRSRTAAPSTSGRKVSTSTPGVSWRQPVRPPSAGCQPAAGVLAEVGDDVAARRRCGAAPGGRRAASPSRPRARACAATACRRRPRAAPGASRPSGAAAPKHSASQPCRGRGHGRRRAGRVGSSTPVGCRTTGNGCGGVEGGRARRVGGVARRPSPAGGGRAVVHEGLDAALPRREVVGDDQGAAHRGAEPQPVAGERDPLRAVVGWLKKSIGKAGGRGRPDWCRQALVHRDEGDRVAGQVERVDVRARLDVP